MTKPEDKALVAGEDAASGGGGVSLGKGAWDCDTNTEIPPEKEAIVFEEVATMEFPFEGIPTVPPRKDMDHMAFFCNGCRYRVSAFPNWPVAKVRRRLQRGPQGAPPARPAGDVCTAGRSLQVKQALFNGGIARANKPDGVRNTPGIRQWEDLELIYAGQRMANDRALAEYHVPPVGGRSAEGAQGVWCGRRGQHPSTSTAAQATRCPRRAVQGCKCLIAIERAKLELGKPDPDSAYWN
jgi:hypothetical protein